MGAMVEDFDHIVIGAGISGLGAAHFSARRGLGTLVLESAPRVGGCIHSHVFEGLGGFWAEAGSHTCFNSYGNLLSILDDLGLTRQVRPKVKVGYRLWRKGERKAVTAALHPLEALVSLPRLFTTPKDGSHRVRLLWAGAGSTELSGLAPPRLSGGDLPAGG